jgi:hypothetical protein
MNSQHYQGVDVKPSRIPAAVIFDMDGLLFTASGPTSITVLAGAADRSRSRMRGRHFRFICRCCRAARQRRPPPAPRVGLKSRQLHADAGDAEDRGAVVVDQPAREADQDRRQGRQPRSLRHVPDGRGRGAAAEVCRNPVADRSVTSAARAGMTGDRDRYYRRRRQRCALFTEKRRVVDPRTDTPSRLAANGGGPIESGCGGTFRDGGSVRRAGNPGMSVNWSV